VTSVGTAGYQTEIRTVYLLNTNLERQRCTIRLDVS